MIAALSLLQLKRGSLIKVSHYEKKKNALAHAFFPFSLLVGYDLLDACC